MLDIHIAVSGKVKLALLISYENVSTLSTGCG
jgi:hypothetical protein